MKKLGLLLFFISFLSCKKEIKNTDQVNDYEEYIDENKIEGIWVNKDYVEELKKNLSPFKSSKYLTGISSILIDLKKTSQDEIEIGLSLGNHEGSNTIMKKKGNNYFILVNDNDWIKMNFDSNKSIFFEIEGEKKSFVKVLQKKRGDGADQGVKFITNKVLFEGKKYSNKDFGKNIIFNTEGVLKNVKLYDKYEVITDFETAPDPIDIILLKKGREMKGYHFKIRNGNLELYEYNEDNDDFELSFILEEQSKHK